MGKQAVHTPVLSHRSQWAALARHGERRGRNVVRWEKHCGMRGREIRIEYLTGMQQTDERLSREFFLT